MPDTIKVKAAAPIIREPSTNNIPAGFIYHLSLVAEAACKLVRMLLIALGLQVGPLLTPVKSVKFVKFVEFVKLVKLVKLVKFVKSVKSVKSVNLVGELVR